MKGKRTSDNLVAHNRRARYDYEISDTVEAGIALHGDEVKSARRGEVQIAEAYAAVDVPRSSTQKPEVWLHGAYFAPYKEATSVASEPRRKRRLLLHRREIEKLSEQVGQKGLTLIPLKLYFKRGRLKLLIGVARGRKRFDKRRVIESKRTKKDLREQV